MRIKKGNNPKAEMEDEKEENEEKLIQCIMCNCMTIEEYLKRHIRYNHLISKEEIIDKLYHLHYPNNFQTVSTQTTATVKTSTENDEVIVNKVNVGIGENKENGKENSDSDDFFDNHDYDGDDLDEQVEDEKEEEDDEKCALCKSERKVISPVATCCNCGKRYHWACVNLTSKPSKDWLCAQCSEASKKAFTQDHAYTSSIVNESAQYSDTDIPDQKSPENRKKGKDKKKKGEVHKISKSDKDPASHDHENNEDDDMSIDRNEDEEESDKKFTLNNIEDLNDMSKGELRELCFTESINPKGTREDLEERLRKHFRKKRPEKSKEKKALKLVEVTEGKAVCRFCGLGWNLPENLELGALYKYGAVVAHMHCLTFASGLIQGGEDSDGIVGFLPDDIQEELQRGSKLRCAFCKEIYATVGCCQKSCTKSYHLPCGIKYGALCEYYGNFDSYCPVHRAKRTAKVRPRNYVLTDLGLIPEQVDADSNYDYGKYKAKLKRLENELSKKGKSNNSREKPVAKEVTNKKTNSFQKRNKESYSSDSENEDEVPAKRKIVKVKKEPIETEEVGRRSGRRVIKKTPGANIYSSAVDELKKLLAKKQEIKLDETYSNLAGTRRKVSIKKEKDDSDDDVNWVKPRASTSRRYAKNIQQEVSDDSEEENVPKISLKKSSKKVKKSNYEEEESVESIKIFLQGSRGKKSKTKGRREQVSDSSEEELPYPKIKKKIQLKKSSSSSVSKKANKRENSSDSNVVNGKRRKSFPDSSINADMESMMDDDSDSHVDINTLLDNLSDEDPLGSENPKKIRLKKQESKENDSDSDFSINQELPESSDFEITEKESSASVDSEDVDHGKNKKHKKEVSFAEKVTEMEGSGKNSRYFNMDEILKKKKSPPKKRTSKKRKVIESCDKDSEQDSDSQSEDVVVNCDVVINEGEKIEGFRTAVYLQDSSDEDGPPPQQNESTDADFDMLFQEGEKTKTSSPDPLEKRDDSEKESEEEEEEVRKKRDESENEPDEEKEEDERTTADILNMALEEVGINTKNSETPEKASTSEKALLANGDSSDNDPFSTTPFKLLFSTFGGAQREKSEPTEVNENLSTTLDPDEFLQKHFK